MIARLLENSIIFAIVPVEEHHHRAPRHVSVIDLGRITFKARLDCVDHAEALIDSLLIVVAHEDVTTDSLAAVLRNKLPCGHRETAVKRIRLTAEVHTNGVLASHQRNAVEAIRRVFEHDNGHHAHGSDLAPSVVKRLIRVRAREGHFEDALHHVKPLLHGVRAVQVRVAGCQRKPLTCGVGHT